jgi:hypothetical protein
MKKQVFKPTRAELLQTIHTLMEALEDSGTHDDLLETTRELLSRESLSKTTLEIIGSGINSSGDALQLAVLRGWNVERFAVGVERGKDFLEVDAPAMGLSFDLRLPARGFAQLETLAAACQGLLTDTRALRFVSGDGKGKK